MGWDGMGSTLSMAVFFTEMLVMGFDIFVFERSPFLQPQ